METLKSLIHNHHTESTKANVLLLRIPSGTDSLDSEGDRYESALSERGYRPVSVPVLTTTYTNLEQLKNVIKDGPTRRGYVGVVITSGRSCEAWKTVVLDLVGMDPEMEQGNAGNWGSVPFYVVGETTAKALSSIRDAVGEYPLSPHDIRGAAESGTSEKLAHFILRDLSSKDGSKKLLYLTGDKNRDTLPSILSGGDVELDAIQIYATQGSSTFPADLQKALDSFPQHEASNKWWITYFAPSDADFATPALREHFALPPANGSAADSSTKPAPSRIARIAAIGPTSASHLRDKLALHVDVVAPKPNAQSLADAIADFDATLNVN